MTTDCTIKIVPPQDRYLAYNLATNTQALANYLPGGEFYRAKNITDSNFRKFLAGIANEIIRIENKLKELADNYYIWTTDALLTEWERTLGIPDTCFKVQDKTLDMRRRQVIAKLALSNIQTREDFIFLACFLGFDIEIETGTSHGIFPMQFPILLGASAKQIRFTFIVIFKDRLRPTSVFPAQFPILLGLDDTGVLRCLFNKLKPAETRVIFRYSND